MALKAKLATLEGLDEATQKLYIKPTIDGSEADFYVLDVEDVSDGKSTWALEDVGGLRRAHENSKEEARQAREGNRPLTDLLAWAKEKFGVDGLDAVRASLTDWKRLKDVDPESDVATQVAAQLESVKDEMKQSFAGEKAGFETKIEKLHRVLGNLTLGQQARDALTKHKGNPKLLLQPLLAMGRYRITDDEQVVVEILNDQGAPRVGSGDKPFTFDDLVGEMRNDPDYGAAFDSTGAGGGGASAGGAGGNDPSQKKPGGAGKISSKKDLKDPVARADYIEKHGRDAFLSLPAE